MQPHSPVPSPVGLRRPHVRRQPAPLPLWFVFGVVGVAVLASVIVGILVFSAVRSMAGRDGGGPPQVGIGLPSLPNIFDPNNSGGADPGATPQGGNWNCQGWTSRVTVLLMGIDQREGEQGPFRTDTMMLLSLDPVNKTAVMLSIPRDLWVTIPDYGYGPVNDRINTANVAGDLYQYPGGGPALAVRTVRLNLGIPVDHYVRVNFNAFETFVNQIGGIDVDVPEDIYDPDYPSTDPNDPYGTVVFQIDTGHHHLDGRTALQYARTRHTLGSDFDRAKRQQQVVLAVRDRILNLKQLPELVGKAPQMYTTFSQSVQTDLALNEVVCLSLLSQDVPRQNIRSAVLDENYTTNYTTPEGAQVLVPERDKIGALMQALYAAPSTLLPTSTPDATAQIALENARIVVENGTLTAGLASKTSDYLRQLGLNVVDSTNADRFDYQATLVIDYTGKPYTTRYLATLFNAQPGNILSGSNPNSPVDVKVILGSDVKLP